MQFLLTDQEAIDAIRNGIRRDDGRLLVRLPLSCFQSSEHPVTLTFSADSLTAHWGKRSTRLSLTEFALLQLLCQQGRLSFEAAQGSVWKQSISDVAIRMACSRLSTRLFDAGIPFAILTRNASILLEKAGF